MRLLHVVPTYLPAVRYGGPIQSVHGLCRALATRGHDVHVYTTNVDGEGDSAVPLGTPVAMDGVSVRYFPSRWLRRLYWSPPMARALRREVGSFDLLHTHSVFLWPTTAAARAARAAGIPYVLSPRGMLVRDLFRAKSRLAKSVWMRLIERANLEHASAIHVTSAVERAALGEFGLPRDMRIFEVPNGVAMGAELPPEPTCEPPYLLMLGRINWKKRIEIALETLRLIDGLRLVVAGGDDEGLGSALRDRAGALGVLGRVVFAGPVDGDAKRRLLRGALLLLMPSLSENFGNAALEAMAEGTPVVVVPQVGVAAIVEASGAGFVVEGSGAAFADAVRKMLADPALRRRMGERGRLAVAANFAWPAIAARMESEYGAILNARGKCA